MVGLNMGSGPHPTHSREWIDIDLYDVDASPTVIASVLELPFRAATFDKAFMGHLMEHLGYSDELPEMLIKLRYVLKSGAKVIAIGPDVSKYNDLLQEGHASSPVWLLNAIVSKRLPHATLGGWHRWVPTTEMVIDVLVAAGFVNVQERDINTVFQPEWPYTTNAPWQHCVEATNP